ncbi:hypothetical protein Tco_0652227 [Tanacetum coccineum]|uniref:Uncharacterized protein n=1 Tax=Tanacetum coccineum TaxID=301880 RepID=A0ABQ4WX98_9ASTR
MVPVGGGTTVMNAHRDTGVSSSLIAPIKSPSPSLSKWAQGSHPNSMLPILFQLHQCHIAKVVGSASNSPGPVMSSLLEHFVNSDPILGYLKINSESSCLPHLQLPYRYAVMAMRLKNEHMISHLSEKLSLELRVGTLLEAACVYRFGEIFVGSILREMQISCGLVSIVDYVPVWILECSTDEVGGIGSVSDIF